MTASVSQVLQAQRAPRAGVARPPRLVIAGAGGALGNAVTRELIGAHAWRPVTVLTREPMRMALAGVSACDVSGWPPAQADGALSWPPLPAEAAVLMFEPPRRWHERERALWTPQPPQLASVARWLRASGVRQLAVVVPHDSGRLPDAVRHGLANLDEAAVTALDFDSLLWLRAPSARPAAPGGSAPQRLAAWMLGIFQYMVPAGQRPLAAAPLARVVRAALQLAPPGVHVLAPELLHAAAAAEQPAALLAQALAKPPPAQVSAPLPGARHNRRI